MKVLHFGRFFREQFGGTERLVDLLLTACRDEIHADNLVAAESWHSDYLAPHGYGVYRTASLGVAASTALCPGMPWQARALHRRFRYDIVHLHFPDPLSHLCWLCLPQGPKLVISWHSDIVRQKRLLSLYLPWLVRLVRRADAILVATPRHVDASPLLRAHADPARLHVVPYGLDYAPFTEPAAGEAGRRQRAQFPGRTMVFALGRHVYYKGFDQLLHAMASLDDIHLVLGGVGPLSGDLRALADRLEIAHKVSFVGHIPDSLLPAYYHAADIFCLPSVEPSEAFGLVQLEAMACRKPVVSCELGNGVSFVNQHGVTGLVVPPRDPAALADALRSLADDPAARKRMGEAGYRRATEVYSLAHMKEETLKVYRSLLAPSR